MEEIGYEGFIFEIKERIKENEVVLLRSLESKYFLHNPRIVKHNNRVLTPISKHDLARRKTDQY